jgi:hypothetical protein
MLQRRMTAMTKEPATRQQTTWISTVEVLTADLVERVVVDRV